MLGLLTTVAWAATFDPQMRWRTIRTEHFEITFHQGLEELADEFVREVEPIYATLTDEIGWKPRARTPIVLVDRTDQANGYARVVPYNSIVLFATAPGEDSSLSLYEDWSQTVFTHEYAHVLHLDTNHGIVRLARWLVGRVATTNDVSPWWMVEGFATFQETRHTTGGRGRNPFVDMILRTAVIEDAFPPLGNLDGLQPKPPAGQLRYLFGQDFMRYIADHTGTNVWTRWIHTYGSRPPFWLPARRVFGRPLRALYRDWRASLETRYARQLEEAAMAGPFTTTRRVSDDRASCGAPAFSPTGDRLVWSCYDLRTGSAIWTARPDGSQARVLVQDRGAKTFTWRRDGRAFVYAGTHTVNRFNLWSDIYLYQLDSDTTVPLTNGARARDPDFSPDGSRLLVVTNRAERNRLEVATVDRRREPITTPTDHTQLSTPRYAPDGRSIALSVWQDGRRDLWLYGTDGVPLRRLTADVVIDRDPFWSPDGRWLYFSSDRTGIPNIFAIEIATERMWQVTNLRTGATKPAVSPDGERLAIQVYSGDGWEVHLLDIDRSTWIDWGPLPLVPGPNPPLSSLVHPVELRPVEPPDVPTETPPPRRRRARRRAVRPAPSCTTAALGPVLTPGLPPSRALVHDCAQSPDERSDNFDMTDVRDAFGDEEEIDWTIPPRRYSPLRWVLPRYALPYLQTTPFRPDPRFGLPFAVHASLVSSGADPLRHLLWSGLLHFRTDVGYLGGGFAVTYNRFLPVYSAGFSRGAVRSAFLDRLGIDDDGRPAVLPTDRSYWESRQDLFVSVAYPYRPRTSIFARYTLSFRDNLFELPEDVYLPTVPIRGRIGTLAGGWRYAWSQPTPYAISVEDGRIFSFIGSVSHPLLGTSIKADGSDPASPAGTRVGMTVAQLTAELREYVVLPRLPNHVLATRLAGGYTLGANQFMGNYQLGGAFGDSAFVTTPDTVRMLRGYALGSVIGDRYWLSSLEYRFPIAQVQRGMGIYPVYLRNLSGSIFVDAGNAFTEARMLGDAFAGSLVGTGVEVNTRWVLGWSAFVTARIGYGIGLVPTARGRRTPTDPRAFYLQLGGSF